MKKALIVVSALFFLSCNDTKRLEEMQKNADRMSVLYRQIDSIKGENALLQKIAVSRADEIKQLESQLREWKDKAEYESKKPVLFRL